ncbi:P-loop containing nucleoside triphosphate hydrolase protein [Aspergillus avenaceus]|uniref:P-loop containing nucleoside triphosphate hydrolase protein n=1 Tax=Aspergillus avenaceus TaxID=36643 RepID=A0A5N6U6Z7_ASPAV|nr:P-loop containing nucleoside triphosphate hydrolase protein [Aspergillus avenaceus]
MGFGNCADDVTFGPSVRGCRDDFDFTITFEKMIFTLLPSSLFTFLALIRIAILFGRPNIVEKCPLQVVKLIGAVVYCALQHALLGFGLTSGQDNALHVSALAMACVSAICIIVLSCLEHVRSARPSILLNGYLFLTLLLDIAQSRTLWLAAVSWQDGVFSRLFTAAVAVKVALVLSESWPKGTWLKKNAESRNPEQTAGIFSLAMFCWLNGIFWNGFRTVLALQDLFELDPPMATDRLRSRLIERLEDTRSDEKEYSIVKALMRTLAIPLLLPVVPRIALIAFRFCQPFLINTLLGYLQEPEDASSKNAGYGLIGATILIYSGIALSSSLYWYLQERVICMSRGAIAGIIYKKSTELDITLTGDSAALTLMSSDIERIRLGFLNLHEFWANAIEVALASWLVERQLGAAFVAPLIVVLCCIAGAGFMNRYTGKRQKTWMGKIQKRVGLTATVIGNMKPLKISGITVPVARLIQSMRVDELQAASKFRLIYVIVVTLGYTPLALSPVVTFAVTARTLDVSTIFTSVSYLLLLTDPLTYVFLNLPNLLAGFTCLERIQMYLNNAPRVDARVPLLEDSSRRGDEQSSPDAGVIVTNGYFGWEPDTPSLHDVNIHIPMSGLTMIVGPVGSGKSTLCKALLGEVPLSEGQVSLSPTFGHRVSGYCDQTPYLLNGSVRDNIVAFMSFDKHRYQEVIAAAGLKSDISSFPEQDETVIGSDGVTLSGGQRQRLSIARALYLGSQFYVFDDVLRGLDANTEQLVFHRVLGLLRRRNATVVFSTHSVRYLPYADHVIALGVDGRVVEQGTFKGLMANESYISSLGIEEVHNNHEQGGLANDHEEKLPKSEQQHVPPESSNEHLIATHSAEDKSRMTGDSAVYRHYFSSIGKRFKVTFVVFGLGWGFFYNWGNIWLQYWADDVSSADPTHTSAFYIGLYALFQMTYLGCICASFMICFRTMVLLSGAKLHKSALTTVMEAPLRFFATTDTGIVVNLFSQDMTLIDNELPISVTNLSLDICNTLGMAAVIASSSPYIAIAYPILFMVLYCIQKFYLRTSRQLRLLDLEAKAPLYSHFLDTIKGAVTIRAFGWVSHEIEANNNLLDQSQKPAYLLAMVQRWLGFVLQVVVAILAIMVVVLATQLRAQAGLTGASLVTLMTFGDILNYVVTFFTQMEMSMGAISRLKYFSENVQSEGMPGEDMQPGPEWPPKGGIRLSGVSASYTTGPVSKEVECTSDAESERSHRLALSDVNLTVRPGEKVMLCGRTGSGKSSMILILLRLLDPLAGTITIDDTPLHRIDRLTLRQRIIAVPQDAVFLPDGTSFKANLDPFESSSEKECEAVMHTVGLGIFLHQRGGLAAGLWAQTLSQGQKQLFSLARAVLRCRVRARDDDLVEDDKSADRGGVLLLDEVGSGVDDETERAMQRVILAEFATYTIVTVSHRLEAAIHYDTVVVMDQGRIVEVGSPRRLLDVEGGQFRALCKHDPKK